MKPRVALVRCRSYMPEKVQGAVGRAIDLLGGISSFIRPQSRVLVKPNLLMAKEPESGIDTHPEVVRAVIRLLKQLNCAVFVGDGPSVWGAQAENVDAVYERSGIKNVCQKEGVSLVKFDRNRWRGKFSLSSWLDDCEFLVSVPKFKTHEFTVLTAAVKNLYGLVSDTHKTELHKRCFGVKDFARILVDIYQEAKPALTIVDGVTAMEGDGPAGGGSLREAGLIAAGADAVAVDSVLSRIMGLNPQDIPTNQAAYERRLGTADINSVDILGENLTDMVARPFILPVSSLRRKIPRPVIEIAKRFIRFYPRVDAAACIKCGACVTACPERIISISSDKLVINYVKCISCFCCQEACPNAAIKIKKSVLARMIGL